MAEELKKKMDLELMEKITEVFHIEPSKDSPDPKKEKKQLMMILYLILQTNAGKDLRTAIESGKFTIRNNSIMKKIKNFLKIKKKINDEERIVISLGKNIHNGKAQGRCSSNGRKIELGDNIKNSSSNIAITLIHELTHALQFHTETSNLSLSDMLDSEKMNKLMEAEARLKAAELTSELGKMLKTDEPLSVDSSILAMLEQEKLQELKQQGKDPESAPKEANTFAKTQFIQSILMGGITDTLKKTLEGKIDLTIFEKINRNWREYYDIQASDSSFASGVAKNGNVTFQGSTKEYKEIEKKIAQRMGIPVESLEEIELFGSQKEQELIDDIINSLDTSKSVNENYDDFIKAIDQKIQEDKKTVSKDTSLQQMFIKTSRDTAKMKKILNNQETRK